MTCCNQISFLPPCLLSPSMFPFSLDHSLTVAGGQEEREENEEEYVLPLTGYILDPIRASVVCEGPSSILKVCTFPPELNVLTTPRNQKSNSTRPFAPYSRSGQRVPV